MPAVTDGSHARVLAAICALAVLIRLPLLWGDFTNFDDDILITRNPIVSQASLANAWVIASGNFRGESQNPMHLANMLNLWLGGGTYTSFVVASLAWLALTLVMLDRFVALYTDQRVVRSLVVLGFAVHSGHLETLAWMSARCHWSGVPFALGAVLCWRRWRLTGHFAWWAAALGSAAFAVTCKPIFISVPLFPMVDDWITRRRPSLGALASYLPFLGTIAWFASAPVYVDGVARVADPLPWGHTPLSVTVARIQFLGDYLLAAALPITTALATRGLSGTTLLGDGGVGLPMHAAPPALSIALICAVGAGLVGALRYHRAPLGWAVMGLAFLVPTMGPRPHPPGVEFGYRYNLFPTLALWVGAGLTLGALWPRWSPRTRAVVAVGIGLLLVAHATHTVRLAIAYTRGQSWAQCVEAFPVTDICLHRRLFELRAERDFDAARALIARWKQARVEHPALPRGVDLELELTNLARAERRLNPPPPPPPTVTIELE